MNKKLTADWKDIIIWMLIALAFLLIIVSLIKGH